MIPRDAKAEQSHAFTISVEHCAENINSVNLLCDDLSVSLNRALIVNQFSCTLSGGSIATLRGPNGSGKSTLFGSLAQMIHSSSGLCRWRIERRELRFETEMIYLPQYPLIFRSLSIRENLNLIAGISTREFKEKLAILTAKATFKGFFHAVKDLSSCAGQLSTGQQKAMLFLAAALSPRLVILLDEPFAGLANNLVEEGRVALHEWAAAGCLVIVSEPH